MVTVREVEQELMPIRDAARLLCIHTNTLRRWGNKGIIREYRLGPAGHRRFSRQDVSNLLDHLRSHGGLPPES